MMKNVLIFTCSLLIFVLSIDTGAVQARDDVELKLHDPAPTFVLRDLDDNDVFLRNFCGKLRQPWKNKTKHVVILSFFTSYCQPCLKEIPELQRIAGQYKEKDLKVFLVNLKEDKALVKKYVADKGFSLPVLLDRYGMIAKKYGVTSVPRIFIINKDGKLAWMTKGYDKQLAENIEHQLNMLFKQ